MKIFRPLAPLGAILLTLGLILAAAYAALTSGNGEWLIPSPDTVCDQMVQQLAAHDLSSARSHLTQDLQKQVDDQDLLKIIQAIEDSPLKGIEDSHEVDSQEQGDKAQATIRVKFGNLEER